MNKEDLKDIGIFASIATVLFLLLFFVNMPVQNTKDVALGKHIQYVLNEVKKNTYTVEEPLLINTSFQNSAAVYRLKGNSSIESYASILRITGICGPVPAVFIYTVNVGAEFVGIAGLHNKMLTSKECGISDIQISYWLEHVNGLFSSSDLVEINE